MRPRIEITKEMIASAQEKAPYVRIDRTRASTFDTIYGIIGEYCFAQWFYGEWVSHSTQDTKGQMDFREGIEVKTSAYPFSERLHLLVREDYARKRKPNYYVQTIIDLPSPKNHNVKEGMGCILAGYATSDEIDEAPLKDFGSKFGGRGGYRCRYLQISVLNPVTNLKQIYRSQP